MEEWEKAQNDRIEKDSSPLPNMSCDDSDDSSNDTARRFAPPRQTSSSSDSLLPVWGVTSDDSSERSLGTPNQRKLSMLIFSIGFALVAMAAMYTTRSSIKHASELVRELTETQKRIKSDLEKSQKAVLSLQKEIDAIDALIEDEQAKNGESASSSARKRALNELYSLQNRLNMEGKHADSLKNLVRERSKEALIAKYGDGPYYVELELVFPETEGIRGPTRLLLQLASPELMPHSIHTFLEMVTNELLDGCSFILNALHVLKAAPLPYDGSSAAAKAQAFSIHGLESVSYREYSEEYPHRQYTVGFAADGSPSFYINTEDNSEIHVGDPCFGRVIEGFDTVHRLENSPTRNGIWFEKRIGIKHAQLVSKTSQTKESSRKPSEISNS